MLLLVVPCSVSGGELGFSAPELLQYDLLWKGVKGGASSLEAKWMGKGRLQMVSTAVSVGLVDKLYTVDDRLESIVKLEEPWRAVNYHIKTLEGKHTKDREVFFYSDNTAQRINWENLRIKSYELPREIYDPLSSLYRLRALGLEPGQTASFLVFDTKRVVEAKAEAIRREQVEVPAGTFDTVFIKFSIESEAAFASRGGFEVWLTDDERHLPVKIRTKAPIGYLDAELVGIGR